MALTEVFIIQLILIFIVSAFAITFLKMFYNLRVDAGNSKKLNTALTEIGKLKSSFKNFNLDASVKTKELPDLSSLDLNSITLDQLAEQLGFNTKDPTFMLLKPSLEKHFEKYKKENAAGSQQEMIDGF